MNNTIEYIETDQSGLDSIGFLWEKLNEHHRIRSHYYAGHFTRMTFEIRKKGLLEKAQKGQLRIDIAKDKQTENVIGYCISSITEDKQGEIESIFIESDYRRQNIGDVFMKKALKWMNSFSVAKIIIEVGAGNEEVFGFYARYNFYPRVTILSQPET
jgi:diamine N-acetyltransferase